VSPIRKSILHVLCFALFIAQAFQVADRVDSYDVMATVKVAAYSDKAGGCASRHHKAHDLYL